MEDVYDWVESLGVIESNIQQELVLLKAQGPTEWGHFLDAVNKKMVRYIKKHGLQKPLIVREIHSSKYNILVGGSRYLTLLKLKQTKVSCVVITKNIYEDKYRIKSYKKLLKISGTKQFIYKNDKIKLN